MRVFTQIRDGFPAALKAQKMQEPGAEPLAAPQDETGYPNPALKARDKSRSPWPVGVLYSDDLYALGRGKTMAQSLSGVLIHLIFSTKNRQPFITPTIEPELHPYMASILKALKSPSLSIGGTTDHLHILLSLGRTITVANVVEEVKTGTSKWIKRKDTKFKNFQWQKGYGAFSIGQSNVEALKHYINTQKQHHRRLSFQEEYREFLKRYEIDFDERYVWD